MPPHLATTYEAFQNVASGVANIATAFGIIVGGIWVFWRFSVSRDAAPRAAVSQYVLECDAGESVRLVRIGVRIRNSGIVQLSVSRLFVRLQRIAPCDAEVLQKLREANRYCAEGDWPLLDEKATEDAQSAIEPGEDELLEFDFLVPKEVEIMSVYTHVENMSNTGRGWSCSTWHHFKESPK